MTGVQPDRIAANTGAVHKRVARQRGPRRLLVNSCNPRPEVTTRQGTPDRLDSRTHHRTASRARGCRGAGSADRLGRSMRVSTGSTNGNGRDTQPANGSQMPSRAKPRPTPVAPAPYHHRRTQLCLRQPPSADRARRAPHRPTEPSLRQPPSADRARRDHHRTAVSRPEKATGRWTPSR